MAPALSPPVALALSPSARSRSGDTLRAGQRSRSGDTLRFGSPRWLSVRPAQACPVFPVRAFQRQAVPAGRRAGALATLARAFPARMFQRQAVSAGRRAGALATLARAFPARMFPARMFQRQAVSAGRRAGALATLARAFPARMFPARMFQRQAVPAGPRAGVPGSSLVVSLRAAVWWSDRRRILLLRVQLVRSVSREFSSPVLRSFRAGRSGRRWSTWRGTPGWCLLASGGRCLTLPAGSALGRCRRRGGPVGLGGPRCAPTGLRRRARR